MAGQRPKDLDLRIAGRILAARLDAGVTQRQMGAAIGVSAAQVLKYETGRNRISASDLAIIAALTGRPITSFFDPPADAARPTFAEAQDALVTAALMLGEARDREAAAPAREAA